MGLVASYAGRKEGYEDGYDPRGMGTSGKGKGGV